LLTAQPAQLQQGLDQKQSQNAQLEAQYLQIERELQTSQNELKAQINEQTANEHSIQQLQGEVNELKQQNQDLHALVAQNGQLSTQTLARYTNQIAQLQSQLEAKENELHRHQSLQDNVNDQIFNLQSTITTQHTQLDKLQALNVTLVAQLEAAHRQIGELHESQLTAVNEYHQAQTNLRVLQSERKDTSGVEAQMREMEARYDNLQGQMRDNAARSQDLQNQLQQALASNTTLQIQIQTLHADAVQKNHDLQAARDALTLAQQSHAVLNQNQQFQEQQLQLQINELKSKVSKSKGKNKQVNAQLSDLQGELARVVQQGNQNNDDKKTIEGLQQQIEREKQEHNRLHAEILQLQTDYQSEKAENKSLAAGQKDKTICQAQLENLQYRISQIQPLNKRLTDKLIETEDKLKECHENLAESKNNHQEDIESLEQQYGATETALKQQIENLRAEIDTLQETLNQPANAQSRLSIVFEELDEKAKANPYGASMHLQDEFQILNHKDLDKIVKEFHRKYPNKCKAPASTRVDLNLSVVEKSVDFKRKQVADYLVTCGYTVTVTKVFL
jgi:chromosome segregation ATPase